jgi:mRNA interferase MazF
VLVTFPFSDLSQSKLRPAVVLAAVGRGDFILCQITSNHDADPLAIEIGQGDLARGSLQRASYARPGKLFTGNSTLIAREVGLLTDADRDRIVDAVVRVFRGGKR